MPSAASVDETEFSLSEAGIHSWHWLSAATSPDELARQEIVTASQKSVPLRWVVLQRPGLDLWVEIHAADPLPQRFMEAVNSVTNLLRLPFGWDSYSARPIDPQSAKAAIYVLADLLAERIQPPQVVPTVAGGIQLEWHQNGVDLEIEISASGAELVYFEDHKAQTSWEEEGPVALARAKQIISSRLL